MSSGIYTIENLSNKKLYVGYTHNFKERFANHKSQLNRNIHGNIHLQSAWNKYGEKNFKFEILIDCDEEFLESQEHYWCNILNVHDSNYGYNIKQTHPEKGKLSKNDKLRISIKLKSLSVRPIVMLNLDGSFVKEFELVSDAAQYLGNIQPSVIHRVLTGSRRRYKNFIFIYKDDYNIGNKILYKDKRAKEVLQYNLSGEFIREFNSTMDAERSLGINNTAISACCNKRKNYNSAGGYIWRYKN